MRGALALVGVFLVVVIGCTSPEAAPEAEVGELKATRIPPPGSYEGCLRDYVAKHKAMAAPGYLACQKLLSSEDGALKAGLSAHEIAATVRLNVHDVRVCYEQLLTTQTKLAGTLTMTWNVGADGTIGALAAKTREFNGEAGEIEGCVKKAMRGWLFPAPRGGKPVVVVYPFVFGVRP